MAHINQQFLPHQYSPCRWRDDQLHAKDETPSIVAPVSNQSMDFSKHLSCKPPYDIAEAIQACVWPPKFPSAFPIDPPRIHRSAPNGHLLLANRKRTLNASCKQHSSRLQPRELHLNVICSVLNKTILTVLNPPKAFHYHRDVTTRCNSHRFQMLELHSKTPTSPYVPPQCPMSWVATSSNSPSRGHWSSCQAFVPTNARAFSQGWCHMSPQHQYIFCLGVEYMSMMDGLHLQYSSIFTVSSGWCMMMVMWHQIPKRPHFIESSSTGFHCDQKPNEQSAWCQGSPAASSQNMQWLCTVPSRNNLKAFSTVGPQNPG